MWPCSDVTMGLLFEYFFVHFDVTSVSIDCMFPLNLFKSQTTFSQARVCDP